MEDDINSLGPSADAYNFKPASNLTGLPADSSGAPLASDASLGHPANRSNTLGDDDVSERGPDDVDRDVADPMGNGALGTDPLAC